MSEGANIRRERVERLLEELRYEITRGMMDGDLDETMGFRFYVPISKAIPDGVVFCELRTRPLPRHMMEFQHMEPRLKLVKDTPTP